MVSGEFSSTERTGYLIELSSHSLHGLSYLYSMVACNLWGVQGEGR
jgi:hypothetical protein